tara:strand:- start:357 stop:482 length:126 start_codon:yes stop_codon:yes gene_type:complete
MGKMIWMVQFTEKSVFLARTNQQQNHHFPTLNKLTKGFLTH